MGRKLAAALGVTDVLFLAYWAVALPSLVCDLAGPAGGEPA